MPQLRDFTTSECLAQGSVFDLIILADAMEPGSYLWDDVPVGEDGAPAVDWDAVREQNAMRLDAVTDVAKRKEEVNRRKSIAKLAGHAERIADSAAHQGVDTLPHLEL